MHCGCELVILVLAQSGAPRAAPRFVDVTSERGAPAAAGGVRLHADHRLARARRLADVRPVPLFDATSGPRVVLESLSVDVDGDGDPDRVVASPFGRARLFLNDGAKNGAARFTEAPLCEGREVVGATRFLAFTDLDGDGTPELLIAAPSDPVGAAVLAAKPPWLDGLALRVQRDAANFVAGGVVLSCSKEGRRDVTAKLGLERLPPFRCGTVADLDGDGAPEIVLFGGESDDMKAFWERVVPTFGRIGADPAAAAAALAALAPPSLPVPAPRLLARGADGRFAPVAAEFPADLANFDATSVAATDFDGDGDLDLILDSADGETRFLRNDTRAPGAAPAPPDATAAGGAPSAFVVATGVATPAPALELAAVGGTRIRLDAAHARPLLVAVTSAETTEALAAQARALDGADVVLIDGAASDDATARARTVCTLICELATGDQGVAPLFRIDRDGCVDLVGVRVALARLRDWPSQERGTNQFANDDALAALPRAELAARLPNLALAALAKLEALGATGLDVEFGLALTDTRKFPEAMARFAKASPSDPDLPPALLEVGRKLAKLSRTAEARAAFERAVAVAPADANARFELGRLFLLSKDKENVEAGTESLRVATYLQPDFADAQYAFGQGLSRVGRRDEAITALERALALDPQAVQAKAARDLLDSLRAKKNS